MSALADRDTNLQPTSHPAKKHTMAGEENVPQESQQHKQVLEQKDADSDGYVESTEDRLWKLEHGVTERTTC